MTNLEAYKALLEVNEHEQTLKAKQGYLKAYIFSAILPPLGLYYFIKYFFFSGGIYDCRKIALICLVLTIVSLLVNIWLIKLFISQAIPENSQYSKSLKELITPENLKDMREILR